MTRLKVLTKYFVRDALQDMFNGSKMKSGFMALLMMLLIAFMSLPLIITVDVLYEPFAIIGQEGTLLSLILLIGAVINFFLGIFTIMNTYYFSNDIEHFLPMPFKSSEIVLSKFIAVLINMILYSTIIVVPLLVFAQKSSASPIFFVYIALAVIICPTLPMIIAALVCMLLMRFTNLSKHKDAFRSISGSLSLVLVVLINIISQRSSTLFESSSSLINIIQEKNSLIGALSGMFITNKYAAYGLLYNGEAKGIFYMGISIAICILLCIIYYVVGGKLYLKGIIGISETYSKRVDILKEKNIDSKVSNKSPIKSLVIRDIRIVFRTPQFFINSIVMMLYMPIFLTIIYVANGSFTDVKGIILSGKYNSVIIVGAFLLAAFSICSAGGGRKCLSREGSDFVFSKIIPISYKDQAKSKIISSLCINSLVPILICTLLVSLRVALPIILLGVLSSVFGVTVVTLIQILFDFINPKLKWNDEKILYKDDVVSVVMVFVILILGIGLVAMSMKVESYIGMFSMIVIFSLILIWGLYKKIINMSDEVYGKS